LDEDSASLFLLSSVAAEVDEEVEEDSGGEFIMPTKKEEFRMMKALVTMSSTHNDVLPNPIFADRLISVIKRKFKDGDVTLFLKDLCANLRIITNGVAFVNSWVCSGNQHVTFDPNDMGPTVNLTRSQVLATFREYGEDKTRVCLSLAYTGLMAMAYSNIDKPLPPPMILDLVPAHTQIEFNNKLAVLESMQSTRTSRPATALLCSHTAIKKTLVYPNWT
jgi:hypothetical protein